MKQSFFTILLTVLMSMAGAKAMAYDAIVDNIYYNFSGSEAEVTSPNYNSYSGDVDIPGTVSYNGTTYTVTSIGELAFWQCNSLNSVAIPNTVTSIANQAFQNSYGMTSVNIPSSVTSIGSQAFYGCSGLTSVTIPSSVTSIGSRAFSSCSGLKSVTIPSSVTSISDYMFSYCSGLKSVIIPSSVTSIGNQAFSGCRDMTSVNIPNSVTSIGESAFENCTGLTDVVISNSLTSIAENTFNSCISLTSVTIPNSVTSIDGWAFYMCFNLASVTIPTSVTSIGQNAFGGCSSLNEISIPNSVTHLYGNAFDLTGMYNNAPDGVFYVDKWACGYKGRPENTVVSLLDGTTRIADGAFSQKTYITSITIPNTVTSIGDKAFWLCYDLESVLIGKRIPLSITSDTFSNSDEITLYVSVGSKEAYEAASNWQDFKEIVELEGLDGREVLSEQGTDAPTAITGINVLVNRTINANEWGTICLPFAMTTQQLKTAFGENVQLKEFAGFEETSGGNVSVSFSSVNSLEAYHPYIIKVQDNIVSFLVDNVDIVESSDARVSYTNGGQQMDFVGTTKCLFHFVEDAQPSTVFFISDGQFWIPSHLTQYMKAFRGYFTYSGASGSRLSMVFSDGDATAITTTVVEHGQSQTYDLQGRPVNDSQLMPGLYIRNGKKTVIR